MKKTDSAINLFGLEIFSSEKNELLKKLIYHLENGKKTFIIFTPNPEQVVLAKKQKSFAQHLGLADILIPDGMGLLFASKILSFFGKNKKINERITGIDLSKDLLNIAKKNNLKVLIIGGREYEGREYEDISVKMMGLDEEIDGSNSGTVGTTGTKKPSDKSEIWWTEGYSRVNSPTQWESKAINSLIEKIRPDMVFVAFGAPNQETWIIENKQILGKYGVSVAMAVGGTFDVLFNKINRAPKWMQNLGLEWFYRLLREPWRWHRQIRLLEFIGLTIKEVFN